MSELIELQMLRDEINELKKIVSDQQKEIKRLRQYPNFESPIWISYPRTIEPYITWTQSIT